jgi:hypothetical protein
VNLPRVFATENAVYVQWPGSLPRVWSELATTSDSDSDSPLRTDTTARVQRPAHEAIEFGPIESDYDTERDRSA